MFNAYKGIKVRHARHGTEPMQNGQMSDDYANVMCIVSNSGLAYAKHISMGKTTIDVFNEYIVPLIDDENVDVLCTDNEPIFRGYSKKNKLIQSVTPSVYYIIEKQLNKLNPDEQEEQMKILWKKGKIGNIHAPGVDYDYEEYQFAMSLMDLKLGPVNTFHGLLKDIINHNYKGVPTNSLDEYIAWITYIYNYKHEHNVNYGVTRKIAKDIYIEILSSQTIFRIKDIRKKSLADYSRPTLNEFKKIQKIEKIAKKAYSGYRAHPNDLVDLSKDKIIKNLSASIMKDYCRYAKIKGFSKLKVPELRKLLKQDENFKEKYIMFMADSIKKDKHYIAEDKIYKKLTISENNETSNIKGKLLALGRPSMNNVRPPNDDRRDGKTLFIDTETTGTNIDENEGLVDEILSIAIVDRYRKVIYSAYVKPKFHTEWPEAEKINHISPEYIFKNGKDIETVKEEVKNIFLNANEIIAYNLKFDAFMLRPLIHGKTLNKLSRQGKDCMKHFKNAYMPKATKGYKLTDACNMLGILPSGRIHGAEVDALACYDVWMAMYPEYFENKAK